MGINKIRKNKEAARTVKEKIVKLKKKVKQYFLKERWKVSNIISILK